MDKEIQTEIIDLKIAIKKTTHINLWDAHKTVIRGKFIALNTFTNKNERLEISGKIPISKKLEKEQ